MMNSPPTAGRHETAELLAELTLFLIDQRSFDRAGRVLRALEEQRPGHSTAALLHGMLAFAAERYPDAESTYRRLLESDPGHDLGRAFLAESLIAQQRWREADGLLSEVIGRGRDDDATRFASQLVEGLRTGLFQGAAR